MCGICGFIGYKNVGLLKNMTARLTHRGPDGEGYFFSEDIGLGHRRLAIIDLSGGAQPVFNEDKTIAVISNSEIYNYKELRQELIDKGHIFRSESDTEVIPHAYEEKGVDFVKDLTGMFAIAIWDIKTKELILIRDRFGIKPLHYTEQAGKLIFASEIKAILECPDIKREPNYKAIDGYLTFRYVPSYETFFSGIYELPPACIARYKNRQLKLSSYWKPDFTELLMREDEWLLRFDSCLKDAVNSSMTSDVEVGVYLSGGLDSSSALSYMRELCPDKKIKAFTIGLGGSQDEVKRASRVARYFGAEHNCVSLEPSDIDMLPEIIRHIDVPYGDADIIGLYKLAKFTSRSVKCVIVGDGSDEILGGYIHQGLMQKLYNAYRAVPFSPLWKVLSAVIGVMPVNLLQAGFNYPDHLGSEGRARAAKCLSQAGKPYMQYLELSSIFDFKDKERLYNDSFRKCINQNIIKEIKSDLENPGITPFFNRLIAREFKYWLPNIMLCKQDKIAMAHSLETRFPFLDHRLAELVCNMPAGLKTRMSKDKFILRKVVSGRLPDFAAKRSKQPFHISINTAFGEKINNMLNEYLSEGRIKKRGMLNPSYVKGLLAAKGKMSMLNNKRLMSLLLLEIWFEVYIDRNGNV